MIERLPTRRQWLIASAASGAMLNLSHVAAQTAAAGGDWLAMIEQHHRLIQRSFEELLSRTDAPWDQLDLQLLNLHHVLKAHQIGEEHVIYPAAVRAGLQTAAERLYQQEAEAKVISAQLRLIVLVRDRNAGWTESAQRLQKLVLQHALEEEEQQVYPKLRQQLSPAQNQLLSQLYPLEFSSVVPTRRR
ncbi:hemerythrin domain-containing protein [Ramlibacter rhizophilus]|uniref:Hemerythrin domain-containing protein n=1 Tax=Ramlibacter rhizophilus TaxID=1781167 RepID=A0A4Z0BKM1_9BURK|nr:hemerythrin domain-containing protein [Ramlibacter rhizophilus]TFY99866.1 hemerythrin domain-containing protein [Ramlibacter rhizophilus]